MKSPLRVHNTEPVQLLWARAWAVAETGCCLLAACSLQPLLGFLSAVSGTGLLWLVALSTKSSWFSWNHSPLHPNWISRWSRALQRGCCLLLLTDAPDSHPQEKIPKRSIRTKSPFAKVLGSLHIHHFSGSLRVPGYGRRWAAAATSFIQVKTFISDTDCRFSA